MSERNIKSLPGGGSTGAIAVSGGSAWAFGAAVTLNGSIPTDIHVIGLQFQNEDIPALDVNQDILFEVTVGGVTKLQIPFNMKADTLVGYVMTATASIQSFYLPEAYTIAKGSAVAVKVTDSIAAALTYSAIKLLYLQPSFTDDARAVIAAGIDSAQSEATGWDAKVKPNIPLANIVRTSSTVVTITLQAQADYDITATETITATVPAMALTGGVAFVATPTFTVSASGGGAQIPKASNISQAINRAATR